MLKGTSEVEDVKGALVQEAVRLIMEEALEGEVGDALGRGYYEPGAAEGRGYRNGYRRAKLKTAEGAIEYGVPQVSDRSEPFRSKVRAILQGRTAELERLAVEMYARGLSTRDIEATFRDESGTSLLSRSAVSEVTEALWQQYKDFAERDLSEFKVLYLFVDGIAERLHLGQPREAVLAAWAILENGKKTLLHMAPGTKEDTASCREFFHDLKRRGLSDPVLGTTDGAPGLIRAFEECWPKSLRQRCLAHKMRNLENKVPQEHWPEFKTQAWACYTAASPVLAQLLREQLVAAWQGQLPTAVTCFEEDWEASIAQLRLPINHRKPARTTNLLERLFEEERRRTKTIPHAFGERAVLKLMYAALVRASDSWNGVKVTEFESRQLQTLREDLERAHAERLNPVAASPTGTRPAKVSSRIGT
ncbi:MAG: IS256 family transposase [Acidobacteria bacterium]|nr:IS256 family transposase [Acidobacteriota bacterium]